MKVGLQINDFTFPGGAAQLGKDLARIARTADEGGFDPIGVMDHFFQIRIEREDGSFKGVRRSTRCSRHTRRSAFSRRTPRGRT
jgi:alkanesulfonate monooxygenase SsuD/methylene tetrahydromethanopterin reductase-like flavin-dependent oxidoreductase (luciferase family)